MNSLIPHVFNNMYDASLHLIHHGWVVISLLSDEQTNSFKNKIHESLSNIENGGNDIFHTSIPRVLGGMLKTHHTSMLRPVHEIRKLARTRFFEFLKESDYHVFDYTNFSIPNEEIDLTCNPDAIFVSSSIQPSFPRSVCDNLQNGGLWWHVDTDEERSFIQGSVVLDNPLGSEEFCVISESHKYFNILDESRRLGSDFYMLTSNDLKKYDENNCDKISLRIPSGSYVLWYSSTVHTVKPFYNSITPRIQIYVTFAPIIHIRGKEYEDLLLKKCLAILLGGSCRHLPYPCEITWQNGIHGYTRDLIPFGELPDFFMFSKVIDFFDDNNLNIYGIDDYETLRNLIEYWGYNWDETMYSFINF